MLNLDFTLARYARILEAAVASRYVCGPVRRWHDSADRSADCLMLRHDVDRRPQNAVAMAKLEAQLGIQSTYYFRILPCSFVPRLIEVIRDLGHEIGYHYEDWHLARGNAAHAVELFEKHLAMIRAHCDVRSISMHGSPLARENNMTIWQHADFRQYDVIDAILSFDYSDYVFFTDSGRTFAPTRANLRDYAGNAQTASGVRSSQDLARFLQMRRHEKICLSVHPERWNDGPAQWTAQLARDLAANTVKRVLNMVRR